MTVNYLASHENGEFLWNAKPRFGKTLSVYDFVQKTGAEKVLIVTNRPAISNSWFSDYNFDLEKEFFNALSALDIYAKELAFENISMKDRNNTAPYQEKLKEIGRAHV